MYLRSTYIGDPVPVRVERNGHSAFPFRKTQIWNGRAVPETKKRGTVAFLGNCAVQKRCSGRNGPGPFSIPKIPARTDGNGTGTPISTYLYREIILMSIIENLKLLTSI